MAKTKIVKKSSVPLTAPRSPAELRKLRADQTRRRIHAKIRTWQRRTDHITGMAPLRRCIRNHLDTLSHRNIPGSRIRLNEKAVDAIRRVAEVVLLREISLVRLMLSCTTARPTLKAKHVETIHSLLHAHAQA